MARSNPLRHTFATLQEARIYALEKRSGIGISITFVLIAIIVGVQASVHLHHENKPTHSTIMLVLATMSVVIFLILGAVKWYISDKLESTTLRPPSSARCTRVWGGEG